MTTPSTNGRSTLVSQLIKAPRNAIYRAFIDKDLLVKWLAPNNMTAQVLTFEPREGGEFSMSLTYIDQGNSPGGKTTENTDTFHGRFAKLVPNQTIVQVVEFESPDPAFAGEMRLTWTLAEAGGATEVSVLCENIPTGVRLEDNELGSRESLAKLAALVEGGPAHSLT